MGAAFKDMMATPGGWTIGATAFGEMLPNPANRVTIDPNKKDKWGLPVLAIDCATGENERLMRKDMMATPGGWTIGATAFGEMLPSHANRISLDKTKKDKWGLPVIAIDCATGENERQMRKDMINDMAEMLEACGVKRVKTNDAEYWPGMGIHEMGTARMGKDPKTSVLNAHNQVWDAPNVYVTDGSGMTSAACVNPSLTYMALTARAADHAVGELNRRSL